MLKLIFLCTGNSARSQMAEGLMRHHAGDVFDVFSAGLDAQGVNPCAIEAMKEWGIDISHQKSKNISEYFGQVEFDILITVCSNAEKNCPTIPGIKTRLHWGFEDPAALKGSSEFKLAKFREIRDLIDTRIEEWLESNRSVDEPNYKYKILSVAHLPELHGYLEELKAKKKISDNKIFRSYIDSIKFEVPEDLPQAKSIIVLAIASKLGSINIHYNSKVLKAYIPHNYHDVGPSLENLISLIQKDIIKKPGYHLEPTRLHSKLLAVRSGLAKYGRNNISYVEEMGCFFNLFAFFTDYEFEQDDWQEMEMLKFCKTCTLCLKNCPTGAIRESEMVIDAGKCITVYNEIPGEIPKWIPKNGHNSLIGCIKCQIKCPGNRKVIKNVQEFGTISEKDVQKIIHDEDRDVFRATFGPVFNLDDQDEFQAIFDTIFDQGDQKSLDYFFPIFKRNLKLLLP